MPNTVSLIAGRPDNPDAELLAEFLLSEQSQTLMLQSDSHNLPVRPADRLGVIQPDSRYVVPDPLTPDIAQVTGHMDGAMRAVDTILLGR